MIYISGPMSGYEELNFPAFRKVAMDLRDKGYAVISPAEIKLPQYPSGYQVKDEKDRKEMWQAFMKADVAEMMNAEKVAVMDGWEKSKGATIEVNLAKSLGMEIICAYTLEPIGVKEFA